VTAMFHPAGENEDFNVSASEERMVAEIAQIVWEACGPDPAEFELECLPSFKVDVQRRWPSRSAWISATGSLGRSSGSGAAARSPKWMTG
jgi:UDP-glucose 4-epimerase